MSVIGRITIKLVLSGIIAFAAIILLGYAGFLVFAVTQFGTDPISAGISFVLLGILLLVLVFLMMLIFKILTTG